MVAVNIHVLRAREATCNCPMCLARTPQTLDSIVGPPRSESLPNVTQQDDPLEVILELVQETCKHRILVAEGVRCIAWPQVKVRDYRDLHRSSSCKSILEARS